MFKFFRRFSKEPEPALKIPQAFSNAQQSSLAWKFKKQLKWMRGRGIEYLGDIADREEREKKLRRL
jgi:hypothetical protein